MSNESFQPSILPAFAPAEADHPGSRRRSIAAVFAGLLSIFAVTTATDVVLHATGVFPPLDAPPMSGGLFLLAFAYRFLYDVAGSYLTTARASSAHAPRPRSRLNRRRVEPGGGHRDVECGPGLVRSRSRGERGAVRVVGGLPFRIASATGDISQREVNTVDRASVSVASTSAVTRATFWRIP
jgi:hypothetical protein